MLPACKPGSVECYLVMVIPLGAWSPTPSSSLPAASWSGRAVPRCLFGLAPAGVCHAADVTICAVSSYLTISPLPVPGEPDHWRFAFCCTVRRGIASPRRYLAARPMEPGLSSNACASATIRPTASIYKIHHSLVTRR
jgi:hypothetical protein